ncbi:MAG: hypothetical protein Q8N17_26075 [Burkholderiaceae bacterium]|nr:hypothetical protein [Burkholderiaceae bacterium]
MAQKPALFERAQQAAPPPEQEGAQAAEGATFKRPNLKSMVTPEHKDAVERVVAAGMRYLYSPEMRPEVMQGIESQEPMPQKLGMNVIGLVLTLDNQAKGGIPMGAVFPAAFELLGEAAEMVQASGQTVTQDDFNTAGLVVMAGLAKKLGATDEQVMATAQADPAAPAGEPPQQGQQGEEPMDAEMPENAA